MPWSFTPRARQFWTLLALCFASLLPRLALAAPPVGPTNLTAAGKIQSGLPVIQLAWKAASVPPYEYYLIYRDGKLYAGNARSPYTDTGVAAGETHKYAVQAVGPTGVSALSNTATATAPTPLTAPTNLTAQGVWSTNCPLCKMPMAHIVLQWTGVAQAVSYTVYRDGAAIQTGVTATTWTDMAVVSGQTYTYTITAVNALQESPHSNAASATAPYPPTGATMEAPVNLSVHGFWNSGSGDVLTWDAVPGAASYNVYRYDVLIGKNVVGTTYVLSPAGYNGSLTYTVTAVDSQGNESLPSAISNAQGANNPASPPGWMPDPPAAPTGLVATPEWNAGRPRIHLLWHGQPNDWTYAVYRDGVKIADGLWGLSYEDNALKAGETHVYAVAGDNVHWLTAIESAPSPSVSATALAALPNAPVSAVVNVKVTPNDDSALVAFDAVPGAADYRVYDQSDPTRVKYSGGGLSVEWNGIDPAKGATLIVEAVDKLGPFQKMDGAPAGGMAGMSMGEAINGQGDPSDQPLVLAKSAPVAVTCQAQTAINLQNPSAFLDTFRGSLPFAVSTDMDPNLTPASTGYEEITEVENDKWRVRSYGADTAMTQAFVMGNHFMDTLYDGPTAFTHPFSHNNNASLVLLPKTTADISGGKVLHATFEVDAHFDGRRWCDLFVAAAGDTLLVPGKFADNNQSPTTSGNLFRWEITDQFHQAQVWRGLDTHGNLQGDTLIHTDWQDPLGPIDRFGPCARINWDGTPLLNGTAQDLDKRHRFDLYLSQTHYQIREQGQIIKQGDLPHPLPFAQAQVYFVHQLYHTGNDRPENILYGGPANAYWYNDRPWADERHWDNLGQETLPAFPG